jgi:molybdenum cofactor synthesis domain-containing protein
VALPVSSRQGDPVISLDEARAHVFAQIVAPPARDVPPADSVGCVTAAPVTSQATIPPFDNTAMDGFAVRAADTVGAEDEPVTLTIVGTVAAGPGDLPRVAAGEAARIMTGAPIPPGADAVVMVERTRAVDDRVEIQVEVAPANHIRRSGEDVQPGDVVIDAATVVTPAHLGVLLSVGCEAVSVVLRPRVAVISTGDELVADGRPLRPGQIVDSNRPTLLALVEAAGFIPVDRGLVPDDEGAISDALSAAASECDAVVTSGGVSMGDFDYVKVVLDRIGDMRWMQIGIRPAKPLAFGTIDGTPVFGLPGNPVSSMVSFELFARPALRRMMGHPRPDARTVPAVAAEPLSRHPDGKIHFARVSAAADADGVIHVRSSGGQGSHQLSAMAGANALALLPDGDGVDVGGAVELLLLDELHTLPA